MKIYFKHRKTNFRKKEQIREFLFSFIKKKEERLQVPGSGGWILPRRSGCASIRSTITRGLALGRTAVSAGTQRRRGAPTEVRTTLGAGAASGLWRVARAGSQEMTLTARDRRPDRNVESKFCYKSDNKCSTLTFPTCIICSEENSLQLTRRLGWVGGEDHLITKCFMFCIEKNKCDGKVP